MLSVRQLALRSLLRPVATSSTTSKAKHTLPDLSYDYNALEPVISAEIMQLHHSKHHQTYVNMYNAAEEQLADAVSKGKTMALLYFCPPLKTHHLILLIINYHSLGWNRKHHGQIIHPTNKFTSMNLFKILWVVKWAYDHFWPPKLWRPLEAHTLAL